MINLKMPKYNYEILQLKMQYSIFHRGFLFPISDKGVMIRYMYVCMYVLYV